MKKTFRLMFATIISVAMIGLVSCKEKPEDNPATESSTYSIIYNGEAIAAGATIEYHASLSEVENDFASLDILFENKTNDEQPTAIKLEKVEGPDALNKLMVCFGETCNEFSFPWTSDVVIFTPGINQNKVLKLEYTPSQITSKTTYRLTIGKEASLSDPQVVLININ